jgi:hypothetical protein
LIDSPQSPRLVQIEFAHSSVVGWLSSSLSRIATAATTTARTPMTIAAMNQLRRTACRV